eukprot:jgi/Chrzof1/4733/Cz14g24090.t1
MVTAHGAQLEVDINAGNTANIAADGLPPATINSPSSARQMSLDNAFGFEQIKNAIGNQAKQRAAGVAAVESGTDNIFVQDLCGSSRSAAPATPAGPTAPSCNSLAAITLSSPTTPKSNTGSIDTLVPVFKSTSTSAPATPSSKRLPPKLVIDADSHQPALSSYSPPTNNSMSPPHDISRFSSMSPRHASSLRNSAGSDMPASLRLLQASKMTCSLSPRGDKPLGFKSGKSSSMSSVGVPSPP